MEWFNSLPADIRAAVVAGVSSIVTGAVALVLSFFKQRKTKRELQQAREELELQKIRAETEKLRLENELICGTYTICPNCGSKLLLTDIIFRNDSRKDNKKDET